MGLSWEAESPGPVRWPGVCVCIWRVCMWCVCVYLACAYVGCVCVYLACVWAGRTWCIDRPFPEKGARLGTSGLAEGQRWSPSECVVRTYLLYIPSKLFVIIHSSKAL